MWRLPDGDRCVDDLEWKILAEGARKFYEFVKVDLSYKVDPMLPVATYFRKLPKPQQLAVLLHTLRSLKDPSSPPPLQTAANEGAIAEVCASLTSSLESEFDLVDGEPELPEVTPVRRLLREIALVHPDMLDDPPEEDDGDIAPWIRLVDQVSRVFLTDRRYLGEPEDSWEPSKENYFRSDSPAPSPTALTFVCDELEELLYPD